MHIEFAALFYTRRNLTRQRSPRHKNRPMRHHSKRNQKRETFLLQRQLPLTIPIPRHGLIRDHRRSRHQIAILHAHQPHSLR